MDIVEFGSSTGRLFRVAGPDTAKYRRPIMVLVRNTASVPLSAECRPQLPPADDERNGDTHVSQEGRVALRQSSSMQQQQKKMKKKKFCCYL